MGYENCGRRKDPAKLKLLRGNPSKSRVIPDLEPPTGDVVKPGWLSPGAGVVWDEYAPLCLQMRTLTPADVLAFGGMCELQATFRTNTACKGSKAFDVRLERETANAMRPYFEYFGLTMFSRARLAQPKAAEAPAAKWAGQLK